MEPSSTNSAPVSAKKPLIDNMLAPEQKSMFDAEKAAELFVDGQRASIVVSYILLCIESCMYYVESNIYACLNTCVAVSVIALHVSVLYIVYIVSHK